MNIDWNNNNIRLITVMIPSIIGGSALLYYIWGVNVLNDMPRFLFSAIVSASVVGYLIYRESKKPLTPDEDIEEKLGKV